MPCIPGRLLCLALAVAATAAATSAQASNAELQVETLHKPSECARQARRGDMLSMHYRGSLDDGSEFDSRYVAGRLLTVPPADGAVC